MKSKLRTYNFFFIDLFVPYCTKAVFCKKILFLLITIFLVGCSPSGDGESSWPFTVDAGPDQEVDEHTKVTLSGDILRHAGSPMNSYAWVQISGPSVKLIRSNIYIVHFYAPEVSETTSLTFQFDAGNVNQDSDYDYVTVTINHVDNTLSGRISFAPPLQIDLGRTPLSGALADVDDNGIIDLITLNQNDVSVLINNEDGTLNDPQFYTVGQNATDISTIDVNKDGMVDIVTSDGGSLNISILLANGDGAFKDQLLQDVTMKTASLGVADFNGDEFPDMILVKSGSSYSENINIGIYIGQGDGSFVFLQNLSLGNIPKAIAVTDLNVDGIPDAVITDDFSLVDHLHVIQGMGDGTFAIRETYDVGASPFSVATGDLNGDEIPDVVTANLDSDDISILLGNGDGSLKNQELNYSGGGPRSISIADIDNDGALDIVTANDFTRLIAIHLGVGDGTFNKAVYVVMQEKPFKVLIADMNNDNYLDIVTINNASENISVLIQNTK